MRTREIETVYTADEWLKYMERNGKRLFLKWIARQAKSLIIMFLIAVAILGTVTVVGAVVEMICKF